MVQTRNTQRLAILGLSLGILEFALLIVPTIIGFVSLGLSSAVIIPFALLLPVGIVGLIVSRAAHQRLKENDPVGRKRARLGIVFNTIGVVIGVLLLIVFALLVSSVFGQWF